MLSEALVCSLTEGFGAGALSFEAEEVDGSAARASDFFAMASSFAFGFDRFDSRSVE